MTYTKRLGPIHPSFSHKAPSPLLVHAASLLKKGQLVAFPTETVYGLGANIFCNDALHALFQAKQRPLNQPLPVLLSSFDQIHLVAKEVPEELYVLAEHYLPGPLTIVLKKQEKINKIVSGGRESVAIRLSSHPIAHALSSLANVPLATPSANLSGKPSAITADHVFADLGGEISAVVDGGFSFYGLESTILSLIPPHKPTLLRLGMIEIEQLEHILGRPITMIDSRLVKQSHRWTLHLFSSWDGITSHIQQGGKKKRCILNPSSHSPSHLSEEYIHFRLNPCNLYQGLRFANDNQCEEVLVLCNEIVQQALPLMRRLTELASS